MPLRLTDAEAIIATVISYRRTHQMKPITVAVVDAGGHLIMLVREDGTSNLRPEIAQGKAGGAVAMGLGSRTLYERAKTQPYFMQAMNALAKGALVPVPGGVLVRDGGQIIGAVGVTGDSSDNDEAAAIAAIEAAGFVADPGS